MAKVRIDGVDVGKVAGDWSLNLTRESLAGIRIERIGDGGEIESMSVWEAMNVFDVHSTSSRPELKRRISAT